MTPLLEVRDLSIWFQSRGGERQAVADLSFQVEAGEVLGLVGESGSGKSVTALAVLRLLDPAARVAGSVRFQGRELLHLPTLAMQRLRGKAISMIFQEPMTALNPVMTIGEQLSEAVSAHQPELSRRAVKDIVLASMEAVAIPEAASRYGNYPHQFSGGQRQRILIAMAIANRPQLLIADEPTTALDVTVQAQILELLADLRRRFGLAMVFISHDLAVVSKVADRVMVMRHGLTLESGPAASVFERPLHPYTVSLLGAVPTMRTDRHAPLATLAGVVEGPASALVEAAPGHWVRELPGRRLRAETTPRPASGEVAIL